MPGVRWRLSVEVADGFRFGVGFSLAVLLIAGLAGVVRWGTLRRRADVAVISDHPQPCPIRPRRGRLEPFSFRPARWRITPTATTGQRPPPHPNARESDRLTSSCLAVERRQHAAPGDPPAPLALDITGAPS